MRSLPAESECIAILEKVRWNGIIVSPFDRNSKVYRCANQRYRCKNTNKYFNVRTGTIFQNSKIEIRKWLMALILIQQYRFTSTSLAQELNVSQKTAWQMLKKIEANFDLNPDLTPRTILQIDVDLTESTHPLTEWIKMFGK